MKNNKMVTHNASMAAKPLLNSRLRVQRKRTKGFKMPEGAVYVGRGSKWGNPFKLIGDMIYVDAGHRRKMLSKYVCYYQDGGHTVEEVVKLFRDMLMNLNSHEVEDEIKKKFRYMRDTIKDLQGKKLACWCAEGQCCHADSLIELANGI